MCGALPIHSCQLPAKLINDPRHVLAPRNFVLPLPLVLFQGSLEVLELLIPRLLLPRKAQSERFALHKEICVRGLHRLISDVRLSCFARAQSLVNEGLLLRGNALKGR